MRNLAAILSSQFISTITLLSCSKGDKPCEFGGISQPCVYIFWVNQDHGGGPITVRLMGYLQEIIFCSSQNQAVYAFNFYGIIFYRVAK